MRSHFISEGSSTERENQPNLKPDLHFKNGLNTFLWYCLHMTLKYVRKIKDTAGKNGLKTLCVNKA